jgi:hypothetical protein
MQTGYRLNGCDFLQSSVQTGSGIHPASYAISTWGSFNGAKRPKLEADHSPESNPEVKNGGAVTPIQIYLHDVVHK